MKRRRVVERSEKSRVHQVSVTEILRFALDDKNIPISILKTEAYYRW